MIDDKFLDAAVRIKRKYYELTSNLETYENYLKKTISLMEETLTKVDNIKADMVNPKKRKNMTSVGVLGELEGMMKKLEDDAKRLESYVTPMNDGIEKLAVEEQELYRMITDKHPNLTEHQIVDSVKKRLVKEGLM